MTTSRGAESTMVLAGVPAGGGGTVEAALWNEFTNTPREASQAYLGASQGTRRIAPRTHAGLHSFDQRLVLQAHPAIDAPIEIASRAHFAPLIGMRVGNLADQGFRGRDRYHLHEIDLVRIHVEGHVRPQLEVGPQPLTIAGQMRRIRQHR